MIDADLLQLIIPLAGIAAVLFAIYLARDVLSRDQGTKEMQDVAGTIFEGAVAFIRRQYSTIGLLALVGAVVIGAVITVFETQEVADTNVFGFDLGWRTGVAFLVQDASGGTRVAIARSTDVQPRALTPAGDQLSGRSPAFAPDGRSILFVRVRGDETVVSAGIWVIDPATSRLSPLSTDGSYPRWLT